MRAVRRADTPLVTTSDGPAPGWYDDGVEEMVELVVSRKLPSIFVESSVSDRNVKAVIEGAARRGHTLVVGAELFSDAMGAPGTYEGTYLGMIDHNATTITRALGGEAPERGHNGRLGAAS